MRRLEKRLALWLALACAVAPTAWAVPFSGVEGPLDLGTTPTPEELSTFFAIGPDGKTLPGGSGTAAAGEQVFAAACAQCHGAKLEGIASTGAPALTGGRGTLGTGKPVKTVESYWPYATTLFDYIKRAMPFDAPGSLSDDQVYAVTAFILAKDRIIAEDAVMDRATLPKVVMPNRDGFVPYSGPNPRLYR